MSDNSVVVPSDPGLNPRFGSQAEVEAAEKILKLVSFEAQFAGSNKATDSTRFVVPPLTPSVLAACAKLVK